MKVIMLLNTRFELVTKWAVHDPETMANLESIKSLVCFRFVMSASQRKKNPAKSESNSARDKRPSAKQGATADGSFL